MQLILSTANASITLNEAAEQRKAELLRSAAFVTQITDTEEQATAVRLGRKIKRLLTLAEESRKAVKRPVIDLGKQIEEMKDTFCAPLEIALEKLGEMESGFQEAEQRRVAEALRIRNAEIQALEDERLKVLANAEAQAEAMNDEAGLKRALDAEQAAREADEQARAVIVAPLPVAAKEAGTVTKRVPVIEVVNLHATYAYNKNLVRLELAKSELNAILFEGAVVPGLKISWKTDTNFRQ